MKIQAFSTLGEISHFAISGYFVISGFDITGVYCISFGNILVLKVILLYCIRYSYFFVLPSLSNPVIPLPVPLLCYKNTALIRDNQFKVIISYQLTHSYKYICINLIKQVSL